MSIHSLISQSVCIDKELKVKLDLITNIIADKSANVFKM